MNDFTKEELQEIYDSMNRDPFSSKRIIDKLQSMIDNYSQHECQHVWAVGRNEPIGIDECDNRFFICVKCYEVDS